MNDSRLLDVIENCILAACYPSALKPIKATGECSLKSRLAGWLDRRLAPLGVRLAIEAQHSPEEGVDWPAIALTMIGRKRLQNVRALCSEVEAAKVSGDWVECGVWRGGASIMARYCLNPSRTVYCCDSFDGLPFDPSEPLWACFDYLRVPEDEVRGYFAAFHALDNVKFIKGWFHETLFAVPGPICILRCDGDMYSSTMQILAALYEKVSIGGYVIIDDWHLPDCKRAVTDYFNLKSLAPEVKQIDGKGVYWRKE